jgi:antitoxin component YwqK of YwqJK toxin-antitoxin module
VVGAAALRVALLALALAAPAAAQPFVVLGGCRDGQPNGLYELRTPENRLRIVGAFAMGRRTGTFVFWDGKGARIAVIPYDDDVKAGTVAVWYDPALAKADPPRKSETAYAHGELHGTKRSWHPNGKRRSEFRYERGALVEARAWTPAGAALSAARARELAEQDAVGDEVFYETLEALIAANLPQCAPSASRKEKP